LPSFSTLMCSLVEREWTLSSGKEALSWVSHSFEVCRTKERVLWREDIREARNELELVLDLAALVGALLLGSVGCC
jgi:hypothetical protein